MAQYKVSAKVTAVLTNTPLAAIRANARRLRIKQISLVLASGVASSIGLIRASANSTTPVFSPGQPLASTDPTSDGTLETSWAGAPAKTATVYLETAQIGGVVGNGVIWNFPDPVYVEPGTSLLLWNVAAGSSADVQVLVTFED